MSINICMSEIKIDINFPLGEKLSEATIGFLKKILGPSTENMGLLFGEYINKFRLEQNIKMLEKTIDICKRSKIKIKSLNVKQLYPLLDYSSLEEEDEMINIWAVLLSNLLDSDQNITSNVFPNLLSQLSKKEYEALNSAYTNKISRVVDNEGKLQEAKARLEKMQGAIVDHLSDFNRDKLDLENRIEDLKYEISRLEVVHPTLLEDYEFSNLIRLGLVKEDQTHLNSLNFITTVTNMILTPLGERLMALLSEKSNND